MSSTGAWGIFEIEAFTSRLLDTCARIVAASRNSHLRTRSYTFQSGNRIDLYRDDKGSKRGTKEKPESGTVREQRQKEVGIRRNGERENTNR